MNIKHVFLFIVVAHFLVTGLQGQSRKAEKARKNAEKIEHFQKVFYRKARKKEVKARRKMQHKETQKKMLEADRRARLFNRNNNSFFIIRFLKRRKAKK